MKIPAYLRDSAVFNSITPPEKVKDCPCHVHGEVKCRPDDNQRSQQKKGLFPLNAIPDGKRSEYEFVDTKRYTDGTYSKIMVNERTLNILSSGAGWVDVPVSLWDIGSLHG